MTADSPTPEQLDARMRTGLTMMPPLGSVSTGRRGFLRGGALVAAGGLLTGCQFFQAEDDAAAPPTDPTAPVPESDLNVAELAAGLEVLAVATYAMALEAAQAGALGEVPPAVAEFVQTVRGHHQEHLDAWNGVLTGAGRQAVTQPNAELLPVVESEFAQVTDVVGAARLALQLETIANNTYLEAIPLLQSDAGVELAASIQPIDMQHAAVLLFVLGEYPVPDVFGRVDESVA